MRLWIATLLAVLIPQDPTARVVDEDFKDLEDEDATVRRFSFEELRNVKEASTQSRLRKSLHSLGTAWIKKAVAERTRAVGALAKSARKGFNPTEFAARQKKVLDLLAAGDTKSMEPIVKEMWQEFYFDPSKADADEKAKAAAKRLDEVVGWQKALGIGEKEKDSLEKAAREGLRGVDDTSLFSLLSKQDQTIMTNNAALRSQLPAAEVEQIWLTNLYRILVGKTPYKINAKLCEAAREHSTDMEEHKFFSHESPLPGKRTPSDRAQRHGASASGENIYMGSKAPDAAFWAWFGSLGHHKNMLGAYAEIGVGNHDGYWTQMFG
jgi:uncharacterized protein YkwD